MSQPSNPAAAWYPDPGHRHELRYWDGATWTEYVADDGHQCRDDVKGALPDTSDIDCKLLSDVDTANRQTSLHIAAASNSLSHARELLRRGVDINAQNKWGATPLHLAVGNDNYEMTELLLQSGAKVGVANNKGETPLGQAVQLGRTRFITLLGRSVANEPKE